MVLDEVVPTDPEERGGARYSPRINSGISSRGLAFNRTGVTQLHVSSHVMVFHRTPPRTAQRESAVPRSSIPMSPPKSTTAEPTTTASGTREGSKEFASNHELSGRVVRKHCENSRDLKTFVTDSNVVNWRIDRSPGTSPHTLQSPSFTPTDEWSFANILRLAPPSSWRSRSSRCCTSRHRIPVAHAIKWTRESSGEGCDE